LVFSSLIFLFGFLPALLALYFAAPRSWRNTILLVASLLFYAWGELGYVALMLVSAAMNYGFGLWVDSARGRPSATRIVAVAVTANLLLLGYFKYANFILAILEPVFLRFGVAPLYVAPIHLPIGISFFTFQALSYVVDVHRGEASVERNPFRVALYISLFPQLIAGPIVRFKQVARELVDRNPRLDDVATGMRRFSVGLGKKVLIANLMGAVADDIFSLPDAELTTGLAWLGASTYAMQIYFDFSGYSDMAIGLGRIFGFHFLENFLYPYIAASLTEFWRRWHISLSTWFRDYLYIPMGGNRRGRTRTAANLLTVFALCGLWHGASWTFVFWGLYHGLFLIAERTARDLRAPDWLAPFRHIYTLLVVLVGWVIFRATSVNQTVAMLEAMSGFGAAESTITQVEVYLTPKFLLASAAAVIGSMPILPVLKGWWQRRVETATTRYWKFYGGVFAVTAMVLLVFASALQLSDAAHNPFIYFRF
jgi:alginate O-acetyltransferase complex protein AlgI